MTPLSARTAVTVFLAFAFAYFLSALIRGVTATLSPQLTQELALQAGHLGLLAGGYFLGFAFTQLPLGAWLDRFGPRSVVIAFLGVAVLGCLGFALARDFSGLLAARVACGIGVSACLMGPLTGFRRWLTPADQLRANSWMLMTGSLGMVASTLPVQWLVPVVGWRALFVGLAMLITLSAIAIRVCAPAWQPAPPSASGAAQGAQGYAQVWRHPYFRRLAPLGVFCYGGLLAVQTLWAAPFMQGVGGYSPAQVASGLFALNLCMLGTFWLWGYVSPRLARRGVSVDSLMARGLPSSFVLLLVLIFLPSGLAHWTGPLLALYCMACSFVTPTLAAVGLAFGTESAGRAMSAYNLLVFVGVFVIQWGIGLEIDGLLAMGLERALALRIAFASLLLCCVAAYVYFLQVPRHNGRP